MASEEALTETELPGGDDGLFLTYENLGGRFVDIIPAAMFLFKVEISSRAQNIPLFRLSKLRRLWPTVLL